MSEDGGMLRVLKMKKHKGDVEWMGQQEMTQDDDMPQMEVLRSDLSELQKAPNGGNPGGTPLVHWTTRAARAH